MQSAPLAWKASWIGPGAHPREDLGVFAFRCAFSHAGGPCRVRLSADNRYKLFVNGKMVAFGPQRGDAQHWFYETIDLEPFLSVGDNELTALVWNFGRWAPMAQHTVRTGFALEGLDHPSLSTPGTWMVSRLAGWEFDMMGYGVHDFYIDIGPGEIIDLRSLWNELDWRKPHHISAAEERGLQSGGVPWMLIPRSIPPMRYDRRPAPPKCRRRFKGDGGQDVPSEKSELQPNQEICEGQPLLLDYEELLCAYPRLQFSGPAGATVSISFAEGMWMDQGGKGHRDEVVGKHIKGYQDRIVLGAEPREVEPLWWRTYRYVLIESDQPVILNSIEAMETGYPLKEKSSFRADDARVEPIWNAAVRTAERCAGETYFDCPYYEQLQYVGDTRIQALIGYYLGRDRALTRNAVETLGWSLMDNGITQSRYPSRQTQVIPPFSLWWVMMTLDQILYDRADNDRWGQEADQVLRNWQSGHHDSREFWNFSDWIPGWGWGAAPNGSKSPINALIYALCVLASQQIKGGKPDASLLDSFFDNDGLTAMRDVPFEPTEHTESLYRLCQQVAGQSVKPWPSAALDRHHAPRCTFYFQYYTHLAKAAVEGPDFEYLNELKAWTEMIEQGLTTFAETPEPTRSDCHAWSAHPILGFFQIVAGVTSTSPGWRTVRIAPQPGSLRRFEAKIAHLDGELEVSLEDGRLNIDTPVPARVEWKGKVQEISPGRFST